MQKNRLLWDIVDILLRLIIGSIIVALIMAAFITIFNIKPDGVFLR